MQRGDIHVVLPNRGIGTCKSRCAVVLGVTSFDHVLVCPFTTSTRTPSVIVEPSPANGLHHRSKLNAAWLVSVPRTKIKRKIGRLAADDLDLLMDSVRESMARALMAMGEVGAA